MVEKRWQAACKSENENASEESFSYAVYSLLPADSELASAFVERKQRLVFFFFFCCPRGGAGVCGRIAVGKGLKIMIEVMLP